jgi:rhodanese-related sulfurtransferase
MTPRIKLSIILIFAGVLLALLPLRSTRSMTGSPVNVLRQVLDKEAYITPDQVASALVREDSLMQLIDLRPASEFKKSSIPGAVNVPYEEMAAKDPETYLGKRNFRNVFYSDDDLESSYAVVIAAGYGYNNCASMEGGLNGWVQTIMNSSFTGKTISARENALFETRMRARNLFTGFNSMPDSMKSKYLNSRKFDPKKLDGGCE